MARPSGTGIEAITRDILDQPVELAARVVALGLLRVADEECDRLGAADDTDAVHDFRVAVRRLRSWLRAYKSHLEKSVPRRARTRLERVARATGESRDAAVHLEWLSAERVALRGRRRVGVDWLTQRLEKRKAEADVRLVAKAPVVFERARRTLARKLGTYRARVPVGALDGRTAPVVVADGGSFGGVAAELIKDQAAVLRKSLAAVREVTDEREAHQARIAAKRLRYILEPVASFSDAGPDAIDDLKALQDVLGDLNDVHVFSRELITAAEDAAAEEAHRVSEAMLEQGGAAAARRVKKERARDPVPGLLALAKRLRERGEHAFAEVERDWLPTGEGMGPRTDALMARVSTVSGELAAHVLESEEIERKYLLTAIPEAVRTTSAGRQRRGEPPRDAEDVAAQVVEIEQGYLPGERIVERLRHVHSDETPNEHGGNGTEEDRDQWLRTVKLGTGLRRVQIEEEVPVGLFRSLWPLTEGRRVRKRRYSVPDAAGFTWEIDEFLDRPLILAEVELPTTDTALEPPDWLRAVIEREVTGEPAFDNVNLAQ